MSWPIKWVPLSAVRFNSATYRDYAHDVGEPCSCMDCAIRANDAPFAKHLPREAPQSAFPDQHFTSRSHFKPRPVNDDDYADRRLTEFSPL